MRCISLNHDELMIIGCFYEGSKEETILLLEDTMNVLKEVRMDESDEAYQWETSRVSRAEAVPWGAPAATTRIPPRSVNSSGTGASTGPSPSRGHRRNSFGLPITSHRGVSPIRTSSPQLS